MQPTPCSARPESKSPLSFRPPLHRAALSYTPRQSQLVNDFLHRLPKIKLDEPSASKELEPFKSIFALIPELVDQLAKDLNVLNQYAINARLVLRDQPEVDSVLENFEKLGKYALELGGRSIDFISSNLSPDVHDFLARINGFSIMEKKVMNTEANKQKFNLYFKQANLKTSAQQRRGFLDKEVLPAFNRLVAMTGLFHANPQQNWLEAGIDPDPDSRYGYEDKASFLGTNFRDLYTEGLLLIDDLMRQAIELQKKLPEEFSNLMKEKIAELFPTVMGVGMLPYHSLQELGALSFRMTAPARLLKAEPEKKKVLIQNIAA